MKEMFWNNKILFELSPLLLAKLKELHEYTDYIIQRKIVKVAYQDNYKSTRTK